MKEKAIIVDIDGTLANIDQRRKELLKTNDWEAFNSKMSTDKLNVWCNELILSLSSNYKVILLTGRMEKYRQSTEDWLERNNVSYSEIYFRGDEDYRSDEIVKNEIYDNQIKNRFNILFVVDDRKKVVSMWRNIGLVCLQCDEGDF